MERLASQLARFDIVRIDHFRALAAYWSVPAGAPNARGGEWKPAPGRAMLQAARRRFPDMPFVAEDLGVITPDVVALRRDYHLPGMRVLQFGFDGFDGEDNVHLPFNHEPDNVVYTGTHDNDTTVGWLRTASDQARDRMRRYFRSDDGGLPYSLLRQAFASVAKLAVVPAQDLLYLGSEARFNTPGTTKGTGSGSWRRVRSRRSSARTMRELNDLHGRLAAG